MRYGAVFVVALALGLAYFIGTAAEPNTLMTVAAALMGVVVGVVVTATVCALVGGLNAVPQTKNTDNPVIVINPSEVKDAPRYTYPTDFIPGGRHDGNVHANRRRDIYIVGEDT